MKPSNQSPFRGSIIRYFFSVFILLMLNQVVFSQLDHIVTTTLTSQNINISNGGQISLSKSINSNGPHSATQFVYNEHYHNLVYKLVSTTNPSVEFVLEQINPNYINGGFNETVNGQTPMSGTCSYQFYNGWGSCVRSKFDCTMLYSK